MTINKATKGRLYPNKAQVHKINTTLNCCRYVYNEMLARNRKVYHRREDYFQLFFRINLDAIKRYQNAFSVLKKRTVQCIIK